ncbi:MAG: PaaI family thioesterase [Salibacteraceae bacterium]
MDLDAHYRKLEAMYLGAPMHEHYPGLAIEIADESCEISLPISDRYFHAANALHGSVYFKLLDDAAFFAVNSIVPDVFVLTTTFNLHLLRPVRKGKLTSRGRIKFKSRNLFIAEAELWNETNKKVAFGTGHFAKSQVALAPGIGYRV